MPTLLDTATLIAAQAHCGAGQRRKYTNEPYLAHPLEVVSILMEHGITNEVVLAAAVLHDVLEDCAGWTPTRLHTALLYEHHHSAAPFSSTLVMADHWHEVQVVCSPVVPLVVELTEPNHQGNRATRKAAECERLSKISPAAQTIKYADLISNTRSIVAHDSGFAKIYLKEKAAILNVMRDGDAGLLNSAETSLIFGRWELGDVE